MSNSYFKFKQFTVHQDACAMKVCTDACILGAWFAAKNVSGAAAALAASVDARSGSAAYLKNAPPENASSFRILDIGCGTGLLMLMLAQKMSGNIRGIELDPACYRQLQENITASPWPGRLSADAGDVRNFAFLHPFDFIISNPPFFEGDLTAATEAKNRAKHSQELTLDALLAAIDANLAPAGSFGVLLPYHRVDHFELLATARQFGLLGKLLVRQTPRHDFFRGILHFARNGVGVADFAKPPAEQAELTIKGEDGGYTGAFVELMKDYYLYL